MLSPLNVILLVQAKAIEVEVYSVDPLLKQLPLTNRICPFGISLSNSRNSFERLF